MRSVTTDTMNVWFLPSDRRAVIGAVRVCVCVCVCVHAYLNGPQFTLGRKLQERMKIRNTR